MDRYTRNHVAVRDTEDGCELRLSRQLRAELGEPVEIRFKAVRTEVARGAAFGWAQGIEQSCLLHAPFGLIIEAVEAELIRCRRLSEDADPLLDEASYAAHLASGIPR